MEHSGLPVYNGPVDHLRLGFRSLEHCMKAPHPVASLQFGENDWTNKLDQARRTYGSHMAMRLAAEKASLSRSHRLPGLTSSHIARDILLGDDLTIGFADFLNDPMMRPDLPKIQLHNVMEAQLGLL